MATSLGFGVLFGSFISLLLVPSLYLVSEDVSRVVRRKRRVQSPPAAEVSGLRPVVDPIERKHA